MFKLASFRQSPHFQLLCQDLRLRLVFELLPQKSNQLVLRIGRHGIQLSSLSELDVEFSLQETSDLQLNMQDVLFDGSMKDLRVFGVEDLFSLSVLLVQLHRIVPGVGLDAEQEMGLDQVVVFESQHHNGVRSKVHLSFLVEEQMSVFFFVVSLVLWFGGGERVTQGAIHYSEGNRSVFPEALDAGHRLEQVLARNKRLGGLLDGKKREERFFIIAGLPSWVSF